MRCIECGVKKENKEDMKDHMEDIHNYGDRIDGTWGPRAYHYDTHSNSISLMKEDLKEDEEVVEISGPTNQLTKRKIQGEDEEQIEEPREEVTLLDFKEDVKA